MAAVAQHPQPKAMSADELARSLRAHLERRGVLRGLTARLRRDITLEVRGQRGDGPQPSSSQQRLRDSVIAEALRTHFTEASEKILGGPGPMVDAFRAEILALLQKSNAKDEQKA